MHLITLSHLAHPINSISRSTTVSSGPSRQASVQSKGTYTVKILSREQLSLTEFPNAYPATRDSRSIDVNKAGGKLRKRYNFNVTTGHDEGNEHGHDKTADYDNRYDNNKKGDTEQLSQSNSARSQGVIRQHDFSSTPNLLSQKTAPSAYATPRVPRIRQRTDPRHVPFTPHDNNRLSKLRQDPSVVSLLSMYDEKGRLDDKAFSNTPPQVFPTVDQSKATLRLQNDDAKRERRESTLRDLMSTSNDSKRSGESEGDLSWAERCIA